MLRHVMYAMHSILGQLQLPLYTTVESCINCYVFLAVPCNGFTTTFITMLQYAAGLSDRNGVRPSVRLSVCHNMNCDKTNESSAEILIPHKR